MTILRYIHLPSWHQTRHPRLLGFFGWCGLFRNLPHVMPGRWGFYFCGFEFGSRRPQDPVGVWLKQHGLWPW